MHLIALRAAVRRGGGGGGGAGEQYLNRLCLSCACRPSRGPTKPQMEGPRECKVASVCEGCDDKSSSVAQVLVTIGELCIDSSHQQLILPVIAAEGNVFFCLFQGFANI